MIQANELRIGNIIKRDNYLLRVVQIREIEMFRVEYVDKSITSNHMFIEHNSAEPIPITEEWLLKFGFSKRESSVCDSFYIGHNPITHDWLFDITWLKNSIDYSYEGNPFYKNGYHEIKYVHQLQNLYFALTNEELTIKQP